MASVKKIRIGKTINCKWAITTNDEVVPLTGRDLTVLLRDPEGNFIQVQFDIERDNIISFTFQGTAQKKLGQYSLSLFENRGKPNQTVVDMDAFILVASTSQEN